MEVAKLSAPPNLEVRFVSCNESAIKRWLSSELEETVFSLTHELFMTKHHTVKCAMDIWVSKASPTLTNTIEIEIPNECRYICMYVCPHRMCGTCPPPYQFVLMVYSDGLGIKRPWFQFLTRAFFPSLSFPRPPFFFLLFSFPSPFFLFH